MAYITWRPYENPTDPDPFFCLDKHNREIPLSIPVPPYPPYPREPHPPLWTRSLNSGARRTIPSSSAPLVHLARPYAYNPQSVAACPIFPMQRVLISIIIVIIA